MTRLARTLYTTSLGVWVGGMGTLAFVVAPTIFRTAPSRAAAGTMFGAILSCFGTLQIALGVIATTATVALLAWGCVGRRSGTLRLAALALMLLIACNAQFYLGPAIERERASVANFESMPPGVPARARFDSLHRWSVMLASVSLVTGAALLLLTSGPPKASDGS